MATLAASLAASSRARTISSRSFIFCDADLPTPELSNKGEDTRPLTATSAWSLVVANTSGVLLADVASSGLRRTNLEY